MAEMSVTTSTKITVDQLETWDIGHDAVDAMVGDGRASLIIHWFALMAERL